MHHGVSSGFLRQDEWGMPPTYWERTGIQKGKRYSLAYGGGACIFGECMERAKGGSHYWNVIRIPEVAVQTGARYGTPYEVTLRLGQGIFGVLVRNAYSGACAVTGEHSASVLGAAHIVPYAKEEASG